MKYTAKEHGYKYVLTIKIGSRVYDIPNVLSFDSVSKMTELYINLKHSDTISIYLSDNGKAVVLRKKIHNAKIMTRKRYEKLKKTYEKARSALNSSKNKDRHFPD